VAGEEDQARKTQHEACQANSLICIAQKPIVHCAPWQRLKHGPTAFLAGGCMPSVDGILSRRRDLDIVFCMTNGGKLLRA
jgi:hypothetical protein